MSSGPTKSFLYKTGWIISLLVATSILAFTVHQQQKDFSRRPFPYDADAQHWLARDLMREAARQNRYWDRLMTPYDPAAPPPIPSQMSGILRMTADDTYDDFPCMVANPRNPDQMYIAYTSFNGQDDEIRFAYFLPNAEPSGQDLWGTWNLVPGSRGDVWKPSMIIDADDNLWVFWAQQKDGNFDLYARRFFFTGWGPLLRLTDNAENDFEQDVVVDSQGRIHLVYQAFNQGQLDIFYLQIDGEDTWSEPLLISDSPWNDWEPEIAVNSRDEVIIVWDTYDRGNYDVMMRKVVNGAPAESVRVTDHPRLENRATVAVDAQDRVWIAFDTGPENWGKDYGLVLPMDGQPAGAQIYAQRQVEVIVLDGERKLQPAKPLAALLPDRLETNKNSFTEPIFNEPHLVTDSKGGIHLLFRKENNLGAFSQYWQQYLTTMTDTGWLAPIIIPYSEGRISMRADGTAWKDGSLWLTWSRDNYPSSSTFIDLPEEIIVENVYVGKYQPGKYNSGDDLREWTGPGEEQGDLFTAAEREQVTRLRTHRVPYQGRKLRLVRGDLHRHTEFSPDLRGTPDGSVLDFYRYMMDAAYMDFGAVTDHQAGGDRMYWWWLTYKTADLFHTPYGFTGMYGYERSISYPHGHRNIIHNNRRYRPLPFFQKVYEFDSIVPTPYRMHNGIDEVLEEDTKLLFEDVKAERGITIPHTTATNMGTAWRYNDPEVEVAVEIFQGDRLNYEHRGAPLSSDPKAPARSGMNALRDSGFVWNAWAKGYYLGVIASSDHLSTHISYAMAYTDDPSREGIIRALKNRHTYGATDNILLEFWQGDHFMGDQVAMNRLSPFRVKVEGTGPLDKVHIIKDNTYVHTEEISGDQRSIAFSWQDPEPSGPNQKSFYYVRVEQKDGNLAWSSPIWVTLK